MVMACMEYKQAVINSYRIQNFGVTHLATDGRNRALFRKEYFLCVRYAEVRIRWWTFVFQEEIISL